ncbi:MAG: AAA family ATPase, partial [Acidimicrobiia bacterium]
MRITRLSLTNFRVFPDVDLELPPGVVGIYGPNGSGKSTLVEAIAWALFGVARTAKDAVRRDGTDGECRACVEFEHDGHLYEISRMVSGASHTVRAEAVCDGVRLAAGATAVRQYVHHLLGMSAEAFRSSVFCEQKQLDAFSGKRPEERRRLVLDLLGITPLDRARDRARSAARGLVDRVEAARCILGDIDGLGKEVAAAEASLGERTADRQRAEQALSQAESSLARAEEEALAQEERKAARDRLATAWGDAQRRVTEIGARLRPIEDELSNMEQARVRLGELESRAPRLATTRTRLAAVDAVAGAQAALAAADGALRAPGSGDAGAPEAVETE